MSAGKACTGLRPACMYGVARPVNAHNSPSCSSPTLFARRDLYARHLGTRHSLGSRRDFAGHRPELPRPVVPRQGRLLCHAAKQNPFRQPKQLDGTQKALANLPGAAFYAAALLLVTAAGALGFTAGSKAPAKYRNLGTAAGAAVAGAVATVAVTQGREKRSQAASVALYNDLMQREDPGSISADEVKAIGSKYGVNFNQSHITDLQQLYSEFLAALIPTDDTPLTGNEPQQLRQFRDALGLENTAAAEVHMNIARRFQRDKTETSSRDIRSAGSEQKRALSRLIYVSYLVFGATQASFLLPLRRMLGIQPATIDIMRRDSAKELFDNYIKAHGGELQADQAFLQELKETQDRVQLSDEIAQEVVREAARAKLERCLGTALDAMKKRTRVRDYSPAVQAVREALDFNSQLEHLSQQPNMPKGLAPANIYGGKYTAGDKDLRELFRIFVEESLKAEGSFTTQLESDVTNLQQTLGLGQKEAQTLRDEITSKIYRRLLRDEYQSGRLEKAPSKAAVLQQLCDKLKFNTEAASALHKSLYRQRLDSILEANKKISDEEAEELNKQRRLLCLPKADIEAIHKDTCGRLFQTTVEDALSYELDRFSIQQRDSVRNAQRDLRIQEDLAKDVLGAASRKAFTGYVSRSRSQRDRLEAAKELKKMVLFSNLVVAPLLEDTTGAAKRAKAEQTEAARKEIAELMAKAKADMDKEGNTDEAEAAKSQADDLQKEVDADDRAEAESSKKQKEEEQQSAQASEDAPASLRKAQNAIAAKKKDGETGDTGKAMQSQKEINLAKDLQLRDRQDIYRNFLLYCLSGDTVQLAMGQTVTVERDQSEFARLSELGDILGLSQFEVAHVHSELAETAYRQQAQQILASGTLTKENTEFLEEMRGKMGLTKQQAEKIIKGVQNQRLLSGMEAAKKTGQLTLQKILDMKEAGVEIDSFVSEEMRLNLYSKEIQSILSNGTGNFDQERLLHQLPKDLSLAEKKVHRAVEEQAKDRKRTTLVQAVSYLRQKKLDESVKALNNLIACSKALPTEEPVQWREQEELQDLFSVYVGRDKDEGKQAAIQKLFSLSDKDAHNLKEVVNAGGFKLEVEEDDSSFF